MHRSNVSRLSRFVAPIIALMLSLGIVQAAAAATGNGDQIVNGFITLVGPGGEQVAIYCMDDLFQYSVTPDGVGSVSVATSAVTLKCDSQVIFGLYPGYRLAINPSPMVGWVYNRWSNAVSICRNAVMTTVTGSLADAPPEHKTETSTGCGYQPSGGA